jgi:hypothetical protein
MQESKTFNRAGVKWFASKIYELWFPIGNRIKWLTSSFQENKLAEVLEMAERYESRQPSFADDLRCAIVMRRPGTELKPQNLT